MSNISNNERDFILAALREKIRMDLRGPYDYRKLEIAYGRDYGSVFVRLGFTKYVHRMMLSC